MSRISTDTRGMEWLNYHHLLYFWAVAREGGLVPAGKLLRLSHPTLSAQVHALEERLGLTLFDRVGRKLVLTEEGRVVYRYAEEIFALGRELLATAKGRVEGRAPVLRVGIVDVVPKLVVRRLLEPALALPTPVRLVCQEDTQERLLADLALHALDVVIADAPVPPGSPVRAFTHALGETGVSLFAAPALAKTLERKFPQSLAGAPVLLPLEGLALRRGLDEWFARHGLRPKVVGEFADSALLKQYGADGLGVFAAPTAVAGEVEDQYGVRTLGEVDGVRERFYALTVERKLTHPAVVALTAGARAELFAPRARRAR